MKRESLLKPVKWLDEQVLRQYTKLGKKFKLDERRRKYFLGAMLWGAHVVICGTTGIRLFGLIEFPARVILNVPDFAYNFSGIRSEVNEEATSDARAINPVVHFYQTFNSAVRLPTFLGGAGLVGKFGLDLFKYITRGEPPEPQSYNSLMYGLGLLSLASSMYIKEQDPKLLQKKPLWEKAYSWIREKVSSLSPEPAPQPSPVPVRDYFALEDRV